MEPVDGGHNNCTHSTFPTCWNNCLQEILANPGMPMAQPCVTEAPQSMAEFKRAVARLMANKLLMIGLVHRSPESAVGHC